MSKPKTTAPKEPEVIIGAPVEVSEAIETLTKEVYETYCRQVGGVAYNGDRLPSWADFAADPAKEKQANAWRAVAELVLTYGKNVENSVLAEGPEVATDVHVSKYVSVPGIGQYLVPEHDAELCKQQAEKMTTSEEVEAFKSDWADYELHAGLDKYDVSVLVPEPNGIAQLKQVDTPAE